MLLLSTFVLSLSINWVCGLPLPPQQLVDSPRPQVLVHRPVKVTPQALPVEANQQEVHVEVKPTYPCPTETNHVVFGESQVVKVKFLGAGLSGCTFLAEDGWPGDPSGDPVVIKTPRNPAAPLDEHELTGLAQIKQLYGKTTYSGRQWMAMEKQPGLRIDQTAKWREIFGSTDGKPNMYLPMDQMKDPAQVKKCTNGLRGAATAAAQAVWDVVNTHGILHRDVHYGNLLFNDDWTEANLIDWGAWERAEDPDEDDVKFSIVQQLMDSSQLPVEDDKYEDGNIRFYGVCDSEGLLNDATYKPAFAGSESDTKIKIID